MSYSTMLFDLDGTLVDTNHLILTCFEHTLREKLSLEATPAELVRYFGEPLVVTLGRFAPDRAEELADFYRLHNEANHDRLIRHVTGMQETIARLSQAGIKLAVVTSKKTAMAWRGLRCTGMDEFFPVVVGVDRTERHKPDPEPALLALKELGENAGAHVLMVGDSPYDILCGQGAGVKTAAVGWTVHEPSVLDQLTPDHWLRQPDDLLRLIRQS